MIIKCWLNFLQKLPEIRDVCEVSNLITGFHHEAELKLHFER